MTILTNSFEGGTNGAVVTTANSGGASGNAFAEVTATSPTFTSARAAHGAMSAEVVAPGTNIRYVSWAATDKTVFLRAYIYLTTTPVNEHQFIRIGASSGYTLVGVGSDGKAFLLTGVPFTKQANAPTALPLNTWIRVELWADAGTSTTTGSARFAYYTLDDTTPIWDSTLKSGINTANGNTAFTQIHVGKWDTGAMAETIGVDAIGLKTGTDAVWGAWPVPAVVTPPTPVNTSHARYLIDYSHSVAANGGALSYSITQAGGTATTPTLLAPGIWAVDQSTTEDLQYTVTVTEAGDTTATDGAVVPQLAASSSGGILPLTWNGTGWE